eukprot:757291-Hanusia_phi.AAC.6
MEEDMGIMEEEEEEEEEERLFPEALTVELQERSDPVVQQNKIFQNMFGLILSGSRGKILDNIINESKFAAVSILKKTNSELTQNRVKGGDKATGIITLVSI